MDDYGWPLGFGSLNFGNSKNHAGSLNEFCDSTPNPLNSSSLSSLKHRRSISDTTALIENAAGHAFDREGQGPEHSEDSNDRNSSLPGTENGGNNNHESDSIAANHIIDDDASLDPSLDPKRARRIIANRQSAQRSRIRKLQYIAELEKSVNSLQMEVSTLTPQVSFLDHQRVLLNVDNSVMKQRIAALVQNVRLKDAHNEALRKEAENLRQLYQQQQQQFGIHDFNSNNLQDHNSSSSSNNNSDMMIIHENVKTPIDPHLPPILNHGGTKNDTCFNTSLVPDFGVARTSAPLSLSLNF